jgi:hypothetical protein
MKDGGDQQTGVERERIGSHAWVRVPTPVDLRHELYAIAVARRRAWHRRP